MIARSGGGEGAGLTEYYGQYTARKKQYQLGGFILVARSFVMLRRK